MLIDNAIESVRTDRVLIENVTSIRTLVKRLVAWGHQRIAFVRGPEITSSFRERFVGYRIAMAEHELDPIELASESASINAAETTIG